MYDDDDFFRFLSTVAIMLCVLATASMLAYRLVMFAFTGEWHG